jgi:hypothetical protein
LETEVLATWQKKNSSATTTHVKDFCENNALKLPDFEKILSQVFLVTILSFLRKFSLEKP